MAKSPLATLPHWHRPAILLTAAAATLAAAAPPGVSAAASTHHHAAAVPRGWPRLPATRSPANWPFAATSPWNAPIGYGVKYNSQPDACSQDVRNISNGSDLNTTKWSVPVYKASDSSRPVTIWDNNISAGFASHLNPGAKPAAPPGGDNDLAIVNTSQHVVDEMWHARVNDGAARVTADDYARYSLLGSGVGKPTQGDNQGVRAYGGSLIGGEIRASEFLHGIHHALGFAEPRNMQRPGWVWPAISQDNPPSGYTGHVPMGQLVFIPRSNFASLGLSKWGLMMARALHWYGAYNVDSSSGWSFYAQPSALKVIGQAGYQQLVSHDIPVLRKLLVCVTNNGPNSVGGGGGYPPQLTPPPFKLG